MHRQSILLIDNIHICIECKYWQILFFIYSYTLIFLSGSSLFIVAIRDFYDITITNDMFNKIFLLLFDHLKFTGLS
ncbi:hypothetical protein V1477_020680 [Vespula maculifrons]|uniref:Uncharacterized protein n=1 Tax=Vespula maculifrons TaxID=7453 RepID=A0ABD2AMV6_VESMC